MSNKQELDKEEMFRKIMPSASPQPQEVQVQEQPAPAPSAPAGNAPRPVNLPELLVHHFYAFYRKKLHGCTCQKCQDDVFGITLNKVQPRYTTSDLIREEDLHSRQMVTETVTAMVKALFIVKRNPHHDLRESVFDY